MCEAGVTNAEPSEDNSISAVKVAEITTAKRGLERNVQPSYHVHNNNVNKLP